MRLPAATQQQRLQEDARQLHEAIWTAHQAGKPYCFGGEPEPYKSDRAAVIHGNIRRFWSTRGYQLHVRLTEDRHIVATLEVAAPKTWPASPVDTAWSQPAIRRTA